MIDVDKVWLPQMVAYAKFTLNDPEIKRCWLEGVCQTGITNYDELIEQIFDDADSLNLLRVARGKPGVNHVLLEAVAEFIHRLDEMDKELQNRESGFDLGTLLFSEDWASVRTLADRVVYLADMFGVSDRPSLDI